MWRLHCHFRSWQLCCHTSRSLAASCSPWPPTSLPPWSVTPSSPSAQVQPWMPPSWYCMYCKRLTAVFSPVYLYSYLSLRLGWREVCVPTVYQFCWLIGLGKYTSGCRDLRQGISSFGFDLTDAGLSVQEFWASLWRLTWQSASNPW